MSEDDPQPGRWHRLIKPAIVVYVLLLAGIVAAYIGISTLDIETSAYVTGPQTLQREKPNAIRGFVLDAPTGRMIRDARLNFSLTRQGGDEEIELGRGITGRSGYVHTTLKVDELDGSYVLSAAIDTTQLSDTHIVRSDPFEFAPSGSPEWPVATSRLSKGEDDWKSSVDDAFEGDLEVLALPGDGELVRGLRNTVWLRMTHKESGEPVEGEIVLEKVEGSSAEPLKKTHKTDALGLVSLQVEPIGAHRWTLALKSRDGLEGRGKVAFTTVPAQFSIELQNPVVVPGEKLRGNVHTLYRRGGFMVDLYDPDHWIAASAFGITNNSGGFEVDVPKEVDSSVVRVQIYESVFDPGRAWDSRYVARLDDGSTAGCREGFRRILDTLAKHEPDTWSVWAAATEPQIDHLNLARCHDRIEALLMAYPRRFDPPKLWINSQQDDRAELETWKADVKSGLLLAVIIALLIGLANILAVVFSSMATSSRQRAMMQAEILDFDGELVSLDGAGIERLAHAARIVIVVGTLILFGIGVVMVLTFL